MPTTFRSRLGQVRHRNSSFMSLYHHKATILTAICTDGQRNPKLRTTSSPIKDLETSSHDVTSWTRTKPVISYISTYTLLFRQISCILSNIILALSAEEVLLYVPQRRATAYHYELFLPPQDVRRHNHLAPSFIASSNARRLGFPFQ